jgi:hypothetical protein
MSTIFGLSAMLFEFLVSLDSGFHYFLNSGHGLLDAGILLLLPELV